MANRQQHLWFIRPPLRTSSRVAYASPFVVHVSMGKSAKTIAMEAQVRFELQDEKQERQRSVKTAKAALKHAKAAKTQAEKKAGGC